MEILKKGGPRINSWGTPARRGGGDIETSIETSVE